MNLILLAGEDFAVDGTVRVCGRRARHLREVLRVRPGQEVSVGRLCGLLGRGRVLSVGLDEVRLEVSLENPPPPPLGIDLLLGMPRPKVLRRVLQSAASMGVKRLVLVNAFKVEKSYFDTPLLAEEAVREELALGLEQARDTVLPEVLVRPRFKPFVEDEAAALWPEPWARLVAHPGSAAAVEDRGAGGPGAPAVVAIGPEGGWLPYEVGLLESRGFQSFGLGPRLLRVDVAVTFVLGQLALLRRRVGSFG